MDNKLSPVISKRRSRTRRTTSRGPRLLPAEPEPVAEPKLAHFDADEIEQRVNQFLRRAGR